MEKAAAEISIRKATDIADAPGLAAIAQETFIEAFGDFYSEDDLAAFLAEFHTPDAYRKLIADDSYGIWLASVDATPAGYAVGGPCGLPAPGRPARAGELKRIYVRAEMRSAGLGARLMETALAWLEARYDPIYLSVYAENHAAHRFYGRYGFRKVGEYEFMVGEQADPEWIMQRFPPNHT